MEDRIDIPQSFFERLLADKRKLAAAIGAVVVILALVGGLIYARAISTPDERLPDKVADNDDLSPGGSNDATDTPAEETETVPGQGDIPSTEPTPSGGGGQGGPSPVVPAVKREPFMAYRLDGALYVARDDGTGERKVATNANGAYALSPDGTTLAYIDDARARLILTNVATGKSIEAGQALNQPLTWSPDSGRLAFVAGASATPEVRLVNRAGSGEGKVASGHSPGFAGDGKRLLFIGGAAVGQPGDVTIAYSIGEKGATPIQASGKAATEAAFGVDGVVAVVVDPATQTSRLLTARAWDYGKSPTWSELAVSSSAGKPTAIARLCSSPDGKYLAYAESGDDGYSRAFVYDVAKKTSVGLSVRRDTYPLCWTSDGSRVFFVEGNAFQGEPTVLMSVRPDGMGRAVLVDGAGL